MEEAPNYVVEITPQAETYFIEFLGYLYTAHAKESADHKADELLTMAMSLEKNPYRGRKEDKLNFLKKEHRFLIYQYTARKSVKIIYFVDEVAKKVYVTDFFGTEMDEQKIAKRSK